MMQKSTTFTTIFPVKKCYFHDDFACKKVSLSLRYYYYYLLFNIIILYPRLKFVVFIACGNKIFVMHSMAQ
jgi:hypothetical protein